MPESTHTEATQTQTARAGSLVRQTRIVFMGTPEFALPSLQALIDNSRIVGVVTQPDRPAGRGRSLQPPPVKEMAVSHDLSVFQPKSLRGPKAVAQLREWAPDVIVTAAIGFILTPEVLAVPSWGTLNVHASLLPRWRGAAPIQAAILAGDTKTGVTIMCTDEGLDTGPILSQRAIPIHPRETAAELHDRLSRLGAELLIETLPGWLSSELKPRPQPEDGVTIARLLHKEDGLIQWERPAQEIDRQVRAFNPWPGAFTFWRQRRLKIVTALPIPARESEEDGTNGDPGNVIHLDDGIAVVTGEGWLRLDQVQLAGTRVMSGEAFLRGHPDLVGAVLGASPP